MSSIRGTNRKDISQVSCMLLPNMYSCQYVCLELQLPGFAHIALLLLIKMDLSRFSNSTLKGFLTQLIMDHWAI